MASSDSVFLSSFIKRRLANGRKMLKKYQYQTKIFPRMLLKRLRSGKEKYFHYLSVISYHISVQSKIIFDLLVVCFLHSGKSSSNLKITILSLCGLFHPLPLLTKLTLKPSRTPGGENNECRQPKATCLTS